MRGWSPRTRNTSTAASRAAANSGVLDPDLPGRKVDPADAGASFVVDIEAIFAMLAPPCNPQIAHTWVVGKVGPTVQRRRVNRSPEQIKSRVSPSH